MFTSPCKLTYQLTIEPLKPGEKKLKKFSPTAYLPTWSHEKVLSIPLQDPMTRSLSDPNAKDADKRAIVGTGILTIIRSTRGCETQQVCQLKSNDGELVFQGFLPSAESASNYMHHQGNQCLLWDVVNSAGKQPMLRRFSIPFDDEIDAIAFLLCAFNNNLDVVKKVVRAKLGDQFYPKARGLPHVASKDTSKMEVDGEEEIPMHEVPYKESLEIFEDVNIQSQLY